MIITTVSTTFAAIAYDSMTKTLRLDFRSGARYLYSAVPARTHQELLAASSKGQYFNHHIRGRFHYRRAGNSVSGS